MEIGDERIGGVEVVMREDELVSPAFIRIYLSGNCDGSLESFERCCSNSEYLITLSFSCVDDVASFLCYLHFF